MDTVEAESRTRSSLLAIRSRYRAAIMRPPADDEPPADEPPADFRLAGIGLRIDTQRGILVTPGDADDWLGSTLDAKSSAASLLRLFVGEERFLAVRTFVRSLVALISGCDVGQSETQLALFANLVVVEPVLLPAHEPLIWGLVAGALATGAEGRDVHTLLPELWTGRDRRLLRDAAGEALFPQPDPAQEAWTTQLREVGGMLDTAQDRTRSELPTFGPFVDSVRHHLFSAVADQYTRRSSD